MSKKGLGKGFDSLLPTGTNLDIVTTAANDKIHHLAIDIVKPKQGQPRQHFNDQELEQLALSISEQGVLQPIIVTELEHNLYTIIAGERRWRASKIAGRTHIPAIVKQVDELQHLELALLENIQRSDLNAIETAKTIERLHTDYQQSYEDIAKRMGKGYTTIVNAVRLLQLPQHMQEALMRGEISEGHGRALLALAKQPTAQEVLFKDILAKTLSVRQAEALAAIAKRNAEAIATNSPSQQKAAVHVQLSKELSHELGVQVTVPKSTSKGKIILSYSTAKEYDTILKKLRS